MGYDKDRRFAVVVFSNEQDASVCAFSFFERVVDDFIIEAWRRPERDRKIVREL